MEEILTYFEISIFVPLIDFVSQMQFMFIGLKEFSTVYFSKYINITNEIALTGALSHRVFDAISVIFLFVIFNFLNTNSKIKQFLKKDNSFLVGD